MKKLMFLLLLFFVTMNLSAQKEYIYTSAVDVTTNAITNDDTKIIVDEEECLVKVGQGWFTLADKTVDGNNNIHYTLLHDNYESSFTLSIYPHYADLRTYGIHIMYSKIEIKQNHD
jgi:hypothetical protein